MSLNERPFTPSDVSCETSQGDMRCVLLYYYEISVCKVMTFVLWLCLRDSSHKDSNITKLVT